MGESGGAESCATPQCTGVGESHRKDTCTLAGKVTSSEDVNALACEVPQEDGPNVTDAPADQEDVKTDAILKCPRSPRSTSQKVRGAIRCTKQAVSCDREQHDARSHSNKGYQKSGFASIYQADFDDNKFGQNLGSKGPHSCIARGCECSSKLVPSGSTCGKVSPSTHASITLGLCHADRFNPCCGTPTC